MAETLSAQPYFPPTLEEVQEARSKHFNDYTGLATLASAAAFGDLAVPGSFSARAGEGSPIESIVEQMDEVAPVYAEFIVTKVPEEGPAPDEIKEEWLGTKLPVRAETVEGCDEYFWVLAREACEVLKKTSPRAYDWWANFYKEKGKRYHLQDDARQYVRQNGTYGFVRDPDSPLYRARIKDDDEEGDGLTRAQYENECIKNYIEDHKRGYTFKPGFPAYFMNLEYLGFRPAGGELIVKKSFLRVPRFVGDRGLI